MGLTCEELYIKHIENGIRALKNGTKTPEEARVQIYLDKLKKSNPGLYDDKNNDYLETLRVYNKKYKK